MDPQRWNSSLHGHAISCAEKAAKFQRIWMIPSWLELNRRWELGLARRRLERHSEISFAAAVASSVVAGSPLLDRNQLHHPSCFLRYYCSVRNVL